MASEEYCEECGRTPCVFHDDDHIEPERFRPKNRLIGVTAFTVGLANKQYGEPEEGGWYYDTFEPVRVFYVREKIKLRNRQRLERWCKRMNEAERRYPPSSVLCSGYWTVIQDAITEPEPR